MAVGEDVVAAGIRASARRDSAEFAGRVGLLVRLWDETPAGLREFVHGEVAGLLHLSPVTAGQRLAQALSLAELPRLLHALQDGQVGVPHALGLLGELEELDLPLRQAVIAELLTEEQLDEHGVDSRTPGELRHAARRAAQRLDAEAAEKRRKAGKLRSGARLGRDVDGLAGLVVTGEATLMARAHAALRSRAKALVGAEQLTQGQREVAALLDALGVQPSVTVQAVVECPVTLGPVVPVPVDVRMSVATALGLSDEPAELTGYGPIDAEAARALLPAADLVKACVDAVTGEVLTVDRPVRAPRTAGPAAGAPRSGRPRTAPELQRLLVGMATGGGLLTDLTTDGYEPSEALGRLVDLRDVTSVFPGDATPARRAQRDHRIPYPQGPTSADNLQDLAQHWHRAKHAGWDSRLAEDGSTVWTSPRGNRYVRRPRRNPPPPLSPHRSLLHLAG